jgi:hypothetical protein
MQVSMESGVNHQRARRKKGTHLNVLCYGGAIARYIAGVHDEDNSLCVWQILAELFANSRVTGNIDQIDVFLVSWKDADIGL